MGLEPERDIIAFDTETTGLHFWHGDMPFLLSMCDMKGKTQSWIWPVDHFTRKVTPSRKDLREIREILEDPSITKIGHNLAFDIRMMEVNYGIKTRGRKHDTMFMAHVFNTLEPSFGLKPLAKKYLRYKNVDEKILRKEVIRLRRAAKKQGWAIGDDIPEDYWIPFEMEQSMAAVEYCEMDVQRTILLYAMYWDAFKHDPIAMHTYRREMRLWPITYKMETRGIKLDLEELNIQVRHQMKLLKKSTQELERLEPGLNINSPKQLSKLLFNDRELEPVKVTPHGQPSVGRATLEQYKGKDKFVDELIKFRSADKALSSFFLRYHALKVPDVLVPGGYSIHTEFRQLGPATGRYACKNPNLQNVANALGTRSLEPIQARTVFGPRPGWEWDHYDYESMELVMFADLSEYDLMINALKKGDDFHTLCANRAWGGIGNDNGYTYVLDALDWTREEASNPKVAELRKDIGWPKREPRRAAREVLEDRFGGDIVKLESSLDKKNTRNRAKLVLYGKLYGGGWRAAQGVLGGTEQEVRKFMQVYDDAMPGIAKFIGECTQRTKKDGYIMTVFGRRLYINPDKAYRGVNYLIQGSAADLLKTKMIETVRWLKENSIDSHLILTVHDELVFERSLEYRGKEKTRIIMGIKSIMEDTSKYFTRLPLRVGVDTTRKNWANKEHFTLEGA